MANIGISALSIGVRVAGDPSDFPKMLAEAIKFERIIPEIEPVAVREMRERAPRRSGALRRSIGVYRVNRLHTIAGTELVYGDVQNKGGRVRSRRGFIVIPIYPHLPPPRLYPGRLFKIKAKRRTFILATKQGKGKDARIVPLYVLRKSVRLKATHWVDNAAPPVADELEQKAVDVLSRARERAAYWRAQRKPTTRKAKVSP